MAAKKRANQKKSIVGKSPTSTRKRRISLGPKTSQQYFALSEAKQESWNRAVHVIAKMRSDGTSLTKASREFGLNPRAVRDRAGSALRKTKSGRYVARKSDKLLRVMVIPDSQGSKQEIAVRGSSVASSIGEYMSAVQKFFTIDDSAGLRKFRRLKLLDENGKRIKLVTDHAVLRKLRSAGALSFESLYRSAA